MNTPDPVMPKDFGIKYTLWTTWRWIYFNPLTIVMTLQAVLFQLALDNPAVHWMGTAASVLGVVVAQIRNRNKDYTVKIADQPKDPPK